MRVHIIGIVWLLVGCVGARTAAAQAISSEVSAAERAVLVELFSATGGERWTSHDGWNSSTPVCDWLGVRCDFVDGDARRPFVAGLSLPLNNLQGALPASLATLSRLQSLNVAGNSLTGALPEALLERWDAHRLGLEFDGAAFSNLVVRATSTAQAGGVLCAENEDVHYRIDLDALTHRAVFQSVRCRAGSRRTHDDGDLG